MRYIYVFQRQLQVAAIEHHYTWEVKNWGDATYNTKMLRHYYIQRLLEVQLKEFNRD